MFCLGGGAGICAQLSSQRVHTAHTTHTTQTHTQQIRTVVFNLKDKSNPDLRGRVAAGVIPPEALAEMSAEDMASDARKVGRAVFACNMKCVSWMHASGARGAG